MSLKKIIHPLTNKILLTSSKQGIKLLQNYIKTYKNGGAHSGIEVEIADYMELIELNRDLLFSIALEQNKHLEKRYQEFLQSVDKNELVTIILDQQSRLRFFMNPREIEQRIRQMEPQMKPQEIKCYDRVKGVVHFTDNIEAIIESRAVRASKGNKLKNNKFNLTLNKGAFTTLILDCHEGENAILPKKTCSKEYILVFSAKVLNDLNYHATNTWIGGINVNTDGNDTNRENWKQFGVRTYTKEQFEDFLHNENNILCEEPLPQIEVVFSEDIPLKYLEEIIICDYKDYNERWITEKSHDGSYKRTFVRKEPGAEHLEYLLKKNIIELKRKVDSALMRYGMQHSVKVTITKNIGNVLARKFCPPPDVGSKR